MSASARKGDRVPDLVSITIPAAAPDLMKVAFLSGADFVGGTDVSLIQSARGEPDASVK
jgi:hypothetical protein